MVGGGKRKGSWRRGDVVLQLVIGTLVVMAAILVGGLLAGLVYQ